MMFKK